MGTTTGWLVRLLSIGVGSFSSRTELCTLNLDGLKPALVITGTDPVLVARINKDRGNPRHRK